MGNLTFKQQQKIKSSIVNTKNWLNKVYSFFDKLYKDTEVKNAYIHTLNKIFDNSLSNANTILVVSNTSIKNSIITSISHIHSSQNISHIHSSQNILAKIIYHIINITFTKIELFLIRYRINQAVQILNVKNIIIITDAIHTIRQIKDLSFHSY